MKKTYWENRKEKTIKRRFGSYEMTVHYMANCDTAQVSIYDTALFRLPLLWSMPMQDEQANAALKLFESIGYFDIV